MRPLVVVLALLLVAPSCGDDTDDTDDTVGPATSLEVPLGSSSEDAQGTTSQPSDEDPVGDDPARPTTPDVALVDIDVAVSEVATFDRPVALRQNPGDGRLYVAEKSGRVRAFDDGSVALDLSDSVSGRSEQGLLGLAFSADGGRLFVDYTDLAGDTVVASYPFAGGRADADGVLVLLEVRQPFSNHNGGDLHLGPDGYLWITLGDGGSGGDPEENGENPDTLLGSILRIDPTGATGAPYDIPVDNPFVDGGGAPEVWLYGVRNPWRIAFDPVTDDLWVADVGQNAWEEISLLPAPERGRGAHLGWDHLEGTHTFEGGAPAVTVGPVHEYSHDDGCSITGGVVYRGDAIDGLDGAYLFADYCRDDLRAIRVEDGRATDGGSWPLGIDGTVSFGVDGDGEVLVLSESGAIRRLVPA